MSSTAKTALLLFVVAVCAIGAVVAPKEPAPREERKVPVTPVNNHQQQRHTWLRV